MKREERSVGALLTALAALGLLAVAYSGTWFEYDHSTGRQTAPNGPYPEDVDGVERDHLAFHATGWEGDVEPSDEALAQDVVDVMSYGIYAAAGALLVVVLGEVPGIARIIRRRVSLVFIAGALAAITAVVVLSWLWLPETMAGYGVDSQYTSRLDEPDGYTHTTMAWGWYAVALSFGAAFAAALFKFQASHADVDGFEERATEISSS